MIVVIDRHKFEQQAVCCFSEFYVRREKFFILYTMTFHTHTHTHAHFTPLDVTPLDVQCESAKKKTTKKNTYKANSKFQQNIFPNHFNVEMIAKYEK